MGCITTGIRTCTFVTGKIEEFKKNRFSTDPKKRLQAHFSLGEALHPVMDSTSPEHRGWQVWDPTSTQGVRHGNAWGSNEGLTALTPERLRENILLINETINGLTCKCAQ